MWLTGHTFEEIRSLNLEDVGNILSYWEENRKADEKEERTRRTLSKLNKGKRS